MKKGDDNGDDDYHADHGGDEVDAEYMMSNLSFGFCRPPLHVEDGEDGLKKYITDALRKSEQKLQVVANRSSGNWEQHLSDVWLLWKIMENPSP